MTEPRLSSPLDSLQEPTMPRGWWRTLAQGESAPDWGRDLPASVVVFLVALPLCLGVALASGAPLSAGLTAGIVGGVVVGLISGSQLMVSGPAAGLTAVVLTAISDLGGFERFLPAVAVAGALQVVLGVARAGLVSYYIPSPVIKGMLAAIGLILILKQLPHAAGWDADPEGDETFRQVNDENTFTALAHTLDHVEWGAVLISTVGLALLVGWDRWRPASLRGVPGPLLVVLWGIGAQGLLLATGSPLALEGSHLVALPAGGMSGLVTLPAWGALVDPQTWRVGVTLGIVASLESLLSLEATDRIDPYRRKAPPNRELIAQGAGNLVSGALGGLPVTGVIVRSAANVSGGARTRWSAVVHGVLLLVAVALFGGLLERIPLAALAAILLHTGYKLASPAIVTALARLGRYQFVPFVTTIVAILLTDLLVGIGIGLAVGAMFVLADHLSSPCYADLTPPGGVLKRWRLHDHVTFMNKAHLARTLETLAPKSRLEVDGRNCQRIDHDVLEILHDFTETAGMREIDYRLVGIPPRGAGAAAH